MRILLLTLITLLTFTFYSCEKEEDEPINKTSSSNLNIGDSIIFGNTTNMIVNTYNDLTRGTFYIDVNNDGNNDVSLSFHHSISQMYGEQFDHWLEILNSDFNLFGYSNSDTTFIHWDTTEYISPNNDTSYFIDRKFNCYRISPKDSIQKVSINSMIYSLGQGVILSSNYNFYSAYDFNPSQIYLGPSRPWSRTVYINGKYAYTESGSGACKAFVNRTINYVGFKSFGKLGWIKFSLNGKDGIVIYESAIQK